MDTLVPSSTTYFLSQPCWPRLPFLYEQTHKCTLLSKLWKNIRYMVSTVVKDWGQRLPRLLHPSLQANMPTGLFDLQRRRVCLFSAQSLWKVSGILSWQTAGGRKTWWAFRVTQGVTLYNTTKKGRVKNAGFIKKLSLIWELILQCYKIFKDSRLKEQQHITIEIYKYHHFYCCCHHNNCRWPEESYSSHHHECFSPPLHCWFGIGSKSHIFLF